jgi:hypothetical protein
MPQNASDALGADRDHPGWIRAGNEVDLAWRLMAKQLRLKLGRLSARQFAPVPEIQRGARDYTRRATGRTYQAPNQMLQQDPRVGFQIQHEYRQAEGQPTGPRLRRSYRAMTREVEQQYAHMTAPREQGGLGLTHEVSEHDPYATPQEMAHDVQHNRRIRTLATASTGGHAFFTDEQNDKFRAVHDVFGHAATGRGFSRHGEEAAWRSHVQMFSPGAREAMTSETRGQNSYLNYSPGGGFPAQSEHLVGASKLAQDPRASKILKARNASEPRPAEGYEQLRLFPAR